VIKVPVIKDPWIKAAKAPLGGPPRSAAVEPCSALAVGLGPAWTELEGSVGGRPGAGQLEKATNAQSLLAALQPPSAKTCDPLLKMPISSRLDDLLAGLAVVGNGL